MNHTRHCFSIYNYWLDRETVLSYAMVDPCKAQACAIQDCLQQNNYDDGKCAKKIMKLYECCSKFYDTHGSAAESVCCPQYDILMNKMETLKRST